MSYTERHAVDIVVGADGTGEGFTPVVQGGVAQIQYVKNNFSNGMVVTVTGEDSGIAIWTETAVNASALRAPRQPLHSQAGAAMLHASGGTALPGLIVVAKERIKIAVSGGTEGQTGRYWVTIH